MHLKKRKIFLKIKRKYQIMSTTPVENVYVVAVSSLPKINSD